MCGYVAMYPFENNGLGEPEDRRLKLKTLKYLSHLKFLHISGNGALVLKMTL